MEVTSRLIEQVRKMESGEWFKVSRCLDTRFVSRPVSGSIAKRLIKLGWVEREIQNSFTDFLAPTVLVRLNAAGMARAAEFSKISEANAS